MKKTFVYSRHGKRLLGKIPYRTRMGFGCVFSYRAKSGRITERIFKWSRIRNKWVLLAWTDAWAEQLPGFERTTFQKIVFQTLETYRTKLAASVISNNPLLKRLMARK